MKQSERIRQILDADGTGLDGATGFKMNPVLPVIFIGKEPRLIGHAKTAEEVDALLLTQRLSCTYISRASLNNDVVYRTFFAAHG